MAATLSEPMKVVIGVLLGMVLIVAILAYFAASGVGGSSVSVQVTSTASNFTSLIPWLGAMCAGGMVLVAIEGRRR